MNWVYLITADDRPRIQSRVMQIFDRQMISILSYASMKLGEQVNMRVCGDIGSCEGSRIAAQILHLEEVRAVRAFSAGGAAGQAVTQAATLFNVVCDRSGQAALLDTLAAIGAEVVLVNSSRVAFEVVGSEMDVAELYERLRRHWPIDKLLVDAATFLS
jgi:hypothetical protein